MTTTTHKPGVPTSRATGVTAQAIANAGTFTSGTAIANSTNQDGEISIRAAWQYGVAPTAGKTIRIHLLAVRGAVTEDPAVQNQVATISPSADTNAHVVDIVKKMPLEAVDYYIYAINVDTGQSVTLTLTAWTVSYTSVTP